MTTGFAVIAIAGRNPDGTVSVLRQEVVRSRHADREINMRFFADTAANMASEAVVAGANAKGVIGDDATIRNVGCESDEPSRALQIDRATHLRSDPSALVALEAAGNATYVVLTGNKVLVQSSVELAKLDRDEISHMTNGKVSRKSFLGLLGESKAAVFGVDILDSVDPITAPTPSMGFADTRTTAPLFSTVENELALHATALAQWQRRTSFCALCGGATAFINAGTCCECTQCKAKSWPRQDPSMIAVISSRDGQQVLLARSKRHPPKLHTVLAGFVEAGETFEAAVAREAFEETGVRIDEGSVKYVGSQPWPFPQSCMIGFQATADDLQPLVIDEKEIEYARWFGRAEVARAAKVQGSTMQRAVADAALQNDPTLPLLIPPRGVIARSLIDLWLDDGKD
jgi:NAD+ diphosphatase